MEFSKIAAVSGKGGLFKILKPGKTGFILESLDAAKTKVVAGIAHPASMLTEISIFTTSKAGSVPLTDVLRKIYTHYGETINVTAESDTKTLRAFLKSVLPDFDEQRVYHSNIKKLVQWYSILLKEAPEVLKSEEPKPNE